MNELGHFFRQYSRTDRGVFETRQGNSRYVSYAELIESALEISALWDRLKLRNRFIAVLWMEQSIECMRSMMAVVLAGGIPVPMHSFSSFADIVRITNETEAEMVVLPKDKFLAARRSAIHAIDIDRAYVIECETGKLLRTPPTDVTTFGIKRKYTPPQETAVIFMSSGSTGTPKGIMLSDRNVLSNVESIQSYVDLQRDDQVLLFKSLGYCSSITGEWLTALFAGCNLQLTESFMHPFEMLRFIREHETTFMCTVPSVLMPLVKSDKWGEADFASLRRMTIVGGPMPSEGLLQLSDRLPSVELMPSYGLTEASPRVTYLPGSELRNRPDSVGIPVKDVDICIVQGGQEVPPGESGEIIVRGPNVMLGYYNRPESTAQKLDELGLHTSDIGYLDGEGFLYITGRKDNAINVGGHTIYPETTERVLLDFAGVNEAAVTGIPDDIWGEKMVAFIAFQDPSASLDELIRYVKQHLQPLFRPRAYFLIERDRMPKTAVGKLNRAALRSMAREWEDEK
ncbi:acyl--CoA ligase [Paenibacillus sp. N3/727]|uniref:class I adenylate-forming enzyme family protein n=1 Tax=Paenibacillus sp. N3/727 TaxID=2925845 RepID=UPI001F5352DB|nr:class I adenylate-forming enzyme family protein [Paenibacillus sp. N3/727]UNK18925.1 acyl--CoA ligase [Paenibacillus sp. N3/727]